MARGRQLVIECCNVPEETVLDDKKMLEIMVRAATKAGANVICANRYHFGHNSVPGYTTGILLDESHINFHAFFQLDGSDGIKKNLLSGDIFCCGNTDPNDILKYIQEEIDLGEIKTTMLDRFLG